MEKNIDKKFNYLKNTKKYLKENLISKGVNVSDEDTFRDLANKVNNVTGTLSLDNIALNSHRENEGEISIEDGSGVARTLSPDEVVINSPSSEKTIKIQKELIVESDDSIIVNKMGDYWNSLITKCGEHTLLGNSYKGNTMIMSAFYVEDTGNFVTLPYSDILCYYYKEDTDTLRMLCIDASGIDYIEYNFTDNTVNIIAENVFSSYITENPMFYTANMNENYFLFSCNYNSNYMLFNLNTYEKICTMSFVNYNEYRFNTNFNIENNILSFDEINIESLRHGYNSFCEATSYEINLDDLSYSSNDFNIPLQENQWYGSCIGNTFIYDLNTNIVSVKIVPEEFNYYNFPDNKPRNMTLYLEKNNCRIELDADTVLDYNIGGRYFDVNTTVLTNYYSINGNKYIFYINNNSNSTYNPYLKVSFGNNDKGKCYLFEEAAQLKRYGLYRINSESEFLKVINPEIPGKYNLCSYIVNQDNMFQDVYYNRNQMAAAHPVKVCKDLDLKIPVYAVVYNGQYMTYAIRNNKGSSNIFN